MKQIDASWNRNNYIVNSGGLGIALCELYCDPLYTTFLAVKRSSDELRGLARTYCLCCCTYETLALDLDYGLFRVCDFQRYLITEVVHVCVVLHLHDVMVRLPDAICWRRVVSSTAVAAPSSPLRPIRIVHLVAVLRSPSHGRFTLGPWDAMVAMIMK